jgi:hypothetical protein
MLSLVLHVLWLMIYIRVLYGLITYLILRHGPSVGREFVSDVVVCAAIYNCGWWWREVGVECSVFTTQMVLVVDTKLV